MDTQNKCSEWFQFSLKKFNNLSKIDEDNLMKEYEVDVAKGIVKRDEETWDQKADEEGSMTIY